MFLIGVNGLLLNIPNVGLAANSDVYLGDRAKPHKDLLGRETALFRDLLIGKLRALLELEPD